MFSVKNAPKIPASATYLVEREERHVSPSAHALFQAHFTHHLQAAHLTQETLAHPFAQWVEICVTALKRGHKLLLFGNGGSAADAQHLAAEFVVRFECHRAGLPALALTTDTSILTAVGNDYGFERLFARQIEALGTPGDIAIAFSTSGTSPNILKALDTARLKGLTCVALTGARGEASLAPLTDLLLVVPSPVVARIQEMHILLGHMLCAAVDEVWRDDNS